MNSQQVFKLEGLHCANCAMKIEAGTQKIAGVKTASVDFVTQKLKIELDEDVDGVAVTSQVKDIVKGLEPDVKVISLSLNKAKSAPHPMGGAQEHSHQHDHNQSQSHVQGVACSGDPVHDHDHGDESENQDEHDHAGHDHGSVGSIRKEVLRFGAAAVLFAAAILLKLPPAVTLGLYLVSYIISGGSVVKSAVRNSLRGNVFDENFLMTIATIGAFAIGEYSEGVAVMLFYQVGELFQGMAVARSRNSIAALMDIRPDYANLIVGADVKVVKPESIQVGDRILVKPGEKVPLDGVIKEGNSMVDTTALTGESVPREVASGDSVMGGFVNKNGLLTIEVTKVFHESTVSKILELVENASSRKAPTEKFITKFARYYTPAVTGIALLMAVVPPMIIPGATFRDWLYRALVFLVVSCPCALVISIPLGFFGGIGGASKRGILIKGSNYLEALNHVDTVVFDKTGTLTKGTFKVVGIYPEMGLTEAQVLEYAAFAESFSNHPIADSIMQRYGKSIPQEVIKQYEEIPGKGVRVVIEGKVILAGNAKLMEQEGISYGNTEALGTLIYLAIDKQYAGYLLIADEIKEDAAKTIKALKELGVNRTVMLTGDNYAVGTKIAHDLGIDQVMTDLLPHEKVAQLELLEKGLKPKGNIVFVGDGVNDAPVLARAHVGVAMGGLGSDAAIEAADVVLMTDEPYKLVTAIKIAQKTRKIVWQNIAFAFGVKVIVLILGAGGLATMWEAVFADVGVALLAVLNAIRAMKE